MENVFNCSSRPWKIFLGILSVAALAPRLLGGDWTAASLPETDALFQRTNGWLGADGDFTVSLTNGLTLWLFSDTFIGEVSGGHRVRSTMINNSAAWQEDNDSARARVTFFHGTSADGQLASLIVPADGRGWFWLFDGAMARGKLILFLVQIERTDDPSAFGFRQIGNWLGEVSNPLAPPAQWQVTQKKIPFARFGGAENKTMILARAPDADLADFTAWRFRANAGWTTNAAAAADLGNNLASEYSVSWLPAPGRFVLINTENGLSEKILARTASEPWGPWSAPAVVYRCPEAAWGKRVFCYAAKAHPMLATASGELIVTYAANSFDLAGVISDARLYWPRFVRVQWRATLPATTR